MSIRVGMIGAGAIADDHCVSINRYPGAEVVAVSDVSKDRCEALKRKYNMPRSYAKWQDLLADLIPVKVFRFGRKSGEYEVVKPENVRLPHRYESRQANWLDAILGKDKPICTVGQALTVQQILDGVYESSASGKEVRIR